MKILFVDDNELNRVVVEDMIEILFQDAVIDTFSSAKDVLDLDTSVYDIILSDITMPQMNGFELYTLLRTEHKYTKPIIAVTALAVSGDKEKMLMHGFNDYISKPLDMDLLEQVIKKYVEDF